MSVKTRPCMIFHVPYPLEPDGASASAIRPVRMLRAFEEAGYEVLTVAGDASAREHAIQDIRKRMAAGCSPLFAYSECSTMPTVLASPERVPTRPCMDLRFLRSLRRSGVPVGLFYRDIYWKFTKELSGFRRLRFSLAKLLYYGDLWAYRSAVDVLFLPSLEMEQYLPSWTRSTLQPLPPGAEDRASIDSRAREGGVRLVFVGGLGTHYRLHRCVEAVAESEAASLVICTRERDWAGVRGDYESLLSDAVEVVHRNGSELQSLYDEADVGVLFLEPREYREFAVPMKLFEYLGAGKPIVATEGTLAGEFVRQSGAGWVLPYEVAALRDLLDRLASRPDELKRAQARAIRVAKENSWLMRARQAADAIRGGIAT